jgi:hypothetical protein
MVLLLKYIYGNVSNRSVYFIVDTGLYLFLYCASTILRHRPGSRFNASGTRFLVFSLIIRCINTPIMLYYYKRITSFVLYYQHSQRPIDKEV